MVQPIRPQDVSNVYRQQAASTSRAGGQNAPGNEDASVNAGGRGRRSDQVSLSDEAQQLRRVLASISELPDVREQRVAFLREQIENGTYDRGIAEVAARMVEDGFGS
jgi:flagellar biosynthesis anti-sigma factor FlgM